METLATRRCPRGSPTSGPSWPIQQKQAGNTRRVVFAACGPARRSRARGAVQELDAAARGHADRADVLLAAITGVWLTGGDNNIFTQIGLVVLVGLACKNAILIVEFAKQAEDEAARSIRGASTRPLRLRPILMTSFAFIIGVVPLVVASGAGAEMRQAMGTAVFAGMLGVTLFGLLLTPVFYVVCRRLTLRA